MILDNCNNEFVLVKWGSYLVLIRGLLKIYENNYGSSVCAISHFLRKLSELFVGKNIAPDLYIGSGAEKRFAPLVCLFWVKTDAEATEQKGALVSPWRFK